MVHRTGTRAFFVYTGSLTMFRCRLCLGLALILITSAASGSVMVTERFSDLDAGSFTGFASIFTDTDTAREQTTSLGNEIVTLTSSTMASDDMATVTTDATAETQLQTTDDRITLTMQLDATARVQDSRDSGVSRSRSSIFITQQVRFLIDQPYTLTARIVTPAFQIDQGGGSTTNNVLLIRDRAVDGGTILFDGGLLSPSGEEFITTIALEPGDYDVLTSHTITTRAETTQAAAELSLSDLTLIDLDFEAVPEPSSAAALAVAAVVMMRRRRTV